MMIHTNRDIKRLRTIGVLLFAVILLSGCVKEELYNTPHPQRGALRITTDWSAISEDAALPESYQLRIGETPQTVSATANTFKELLPQGSYTLWVHNQPQGIAIGAQTATVNTLTNGTLDPLPGYLFAAAQELNIVKDDTAKVNVKMMQIGRKLTLVLKLNAGDAERIASSTATLTGIAHTVELATGKPTHGQTAGTLAPTFVKTTITPLRAANINALAATVQAVGVVAGERQYFKIEITLTDGNTSIVESDLTEALKNFTAANTPLTLDAQLPLPADGSFSGTITNWTEINNGEITIH